MPAVKQDELIARAFGELSQHDLATIDDADRRIVERALPNTMTGVLRLLGLITSVRYVVARGIEGAFAECGVWRGGSVVAMIETLAELGVSDRDIYLYDTFEGMTEPTAEDTSPMDGAATETWLKTEGRPYQELFNPSAFDEGIVRENVLGTGYPADRIHFVRGPVEETIPGTIPGRLALLRLDTDWYESTRHELEHLYPLLSSGGVLIVDDYGHWEGCRRAVDEYFASVGDPVLLNRIDYTGRVAVKA
jgi:O-methyltransferase